MIQENNIYESADPRDNGRKIRVVCYAQGSNKAGIVSHPKGDRRRQVDASTLHGSSKTISGTTRKTGYFFVGIHQETADA